MKVSAKLADLDRIVEVEYNFGENLNESLEIFGEEVVYTRFISAAVIDLQAILRRLIKAEKTDEEIEEVVAAWKLGVASRVAKDPAAKAMGLLMKLSPADRERLLAELLK